MNLESAIQDHPHREALATVLATLALAAADERRARVGDGLDELLKEQRLSASDTRVAEVDVAALVRALGDPASRTLTHDERRILSRLTATGLARTITDASTEEALDGLARSLCWLTANTALDPLAELDATVTADVVDGLWQAVFRHLRALDETVGADGRAEALSALTALARSSSPAASSALRVLADELSDPTLRGLARLSVGEEEDLGGDLRAIEEGSDEAATRPRPARPRGGQRVALDAELVPVPFGPVGVVLGGLTGVLALRFLTNAGADLLLRRKRPAELRVDATGVTIASRVELLGRTVRTSETTIPFANLAAACRDTRFPRLGLYAGLVALALGTFLGASFVGDGIWARSPSLVGLGAAVFGVGVALDMLLSSLSVSRGGKARVVVTPHRGPRIALLVVDPNAADDALRAIASRAR